MNIRAVQSYINQLPVGITFETNQICQSIGGSPTNFGKEFKKMVLNGTLKNVQLIKIKTDNHHL